MPLQGATQWDSLAHVGYDDRFYNDVDVRTGAWHWAAPAATPSTMPCPGIVGRGVLRRHRPGPRGRVAARPGEAIEPDELEAVLEAQGVAVSSGDILAVRTGWRRKAVVDGWDDWMAGNPGSRLGLRRVDP